jgi:RHS repeat-associated protein
VTQTNGPGGVKTFGFDAAGNTSTAGTLSFTYDGRGRMIGGPTLLGTVTYQINALGRRVSKTVAGATTHFHYDASGSVIAESDATGQTTTEYVWLASTPVALLRANAAYFVHADHLDTPRVVTNQSNTIIWRWDSDPFGVTAAQEDPDGNGQVFVQNLRFPGQYFDKETNLHYNYHRDYDPQIGRYVQSDPIGLKGGINTYAYVRSSSIRYVDSLGLDIELCVRRFYPAIIMPYARHCYVRFDGDDSNTFSFDSDGTHADPAPDNWPKSCTPTEGNQDEDCIKREMAKCKAEDYDFTRFNCCHCAERAMMACGTRAPRKAWPNWPINPGPQHGESK